MKHTVPWDDSRVDFYLLPSYTRVQWGKRAFGSLLTSMRFSRNISRRFDMRYWWKSPEPAPAVDPEMLTFLVGTVSEMYASFASRSFAASPVRPCRGR